MHLMRQPALAEFPDAVTKRGAKHLVELGDMVAAGRPRGDAVPGPDRLGGALRARPRHRPGLRPRLRRARARGVEAIAYRCRLTREGIEVAEPISIVE